MTGKPASAVRRSEKTTSTPPETDAVTDSAPDTPTVTISQAMTEGKLELLLRSPLARLLPESKRLRSARKNPQAVDLDVGSAAAAAPAMATSNDNVAKSLTFEEIRKGVSPKPPAKSKAKPAAVEDTDEKSAVLYLGHIPHGFYEKQMRLYFSQFGTVLRLRLSRSPKTAASRGFAFIEFADPVVAAAAADAMDGYLMHGRSLKAKVVPKNKLHEKTFRGANRVFAKIDWNERARMEVSKRSKDPVKLAKRTKRIEKKYKAKQQQLKKLGFQYAVPEIVKPSQPPGRK